MKPNTKEYIMYLDVNSQYFDLDDIIACRYMLSVTVKPQITVGSFFFWIFYEIFQLYLWLWLSHGFSCHCVTIHQQLTACLPLMPCIKGQTMLHYSFKRCRCLSWTELLPKCFSTRCRFCWNVSLPLILIDLYLLHRSKCWGGAVAKSQIHKWVVKVSPRPFFLLSQCQPALYQGVATRRLANITCHIGDQSRPCSSAEKMLGKFFYRINRDKARGSCLFRRTFQNAIISCVKNALKRATDERTPFQLN